MNIIRALTGGYASGENKMEDYPVTQGGPGMQNMMIKQRTFREQMQDQISHHQSKIKDLQAVLDSLTPEVEKFVEAVQKIS